MAWMDIGKSVGSDGLRGVRVMVGVCVIVLEGEGEALGLGVNVLVIVTVGEDVLVPVDGDVGLIEALRVEVGPRVKPGANVSIGFGAMLPSAGRDRGGEGVAASGAAACPQALKNKPRTSKVKARLYILCMENAPEKTLCPAGYAQLYRLTDKTYNFPVRV
jgi:hypothetical protein